MKHRYMRQIRAASSVTNADGVWADRVWARRERRRRLPFAQLQTAIETEVLLPLLQRLVK